jgi:predicted RNA-binding Zn-ribbon protein involved in translation (DUF1610 family)
MGIGSWLKGKVGTKEKTFQQTEELVPCSRCSFEYPRSHLVKEEDGRFCRDCVPLHKKDKEDADFKKQQQESMSKIKFYCYNCKFHFSRKKDFTIKSCPNCGSDNFVPESKIL